MGSKIYTRKGDLGQTSLFSGEKVAKDDLRLQAYGALDELQAQLGMARALTKNEELGPISDRDSARHFGRLRRTGVEHQCSRPPAPPHREERHGAAGRIYRQLHRALPSAQALHHAGHELPTAQRCTWREPSAAARSVTSVGVHREIGSYDEILVIYQSLVRFAVRAGLVDGSDGSCGRYRAGGSPLRNEMRPR